MPASSHTLDRLSVTFDDDHAVADAGLVLTGTLVQRLGLERLIDDTVGVGYRPGRKLLTLVHTLIAGGDCIDDVALLRAGATSRVVGHDTVAASTVGTWLRQFTFGHVRQLDRVSEIALARAWQAGAGPGAAPMTIDIDSTICEVHGYAKQGAAYGYTRQLGLHPLVATRADTGEVLHPGCAKARAAPDGARSGSCENSSAGSVVRGATGKLTIRADAGFWSHKVMDACVAHDVDFSITVARQKPIVAAIEAIADDAWVDIAYTAGGTAQVAETKFGAYRLIVRRTKITDDPDLPTLFADWRHHAFITNRTGDPVALDADHRAHAVVELAIRDLKTGAGLAHCPSGIFTANAAWLIATTLAHNLVRWTQLLGVDTPRLRVAKTLRRRLLAIPGRLTRSARRHTLHLPVRWPWRRAFEDTFARLRDLPAIG